MEKGRRKIRACLLGILAVAVLFGLCYYYGGEEEYDKENAGGTLVRQEESYGC